jgi:phage-related protein
MTNRSTVHRWRDYRTAAGRRPVKEALDRLGYEEVRADGRNVIYRVLFAPQGSRGQVFLSLELLTKKTQRTPRQTIRLAKERLADWERRGQVDL